MLIFSWSFSQKAHPAILQSLWLHSPPWHHMPPPPPSPHSPLILNVAICGEHPSGEPTKLKMPSRASKQPEIPMRKGSVPTRDHGQEAEIGELRRHRMACTLLWAFTLYSLRLYSSLNFYSYPAADPGFVGLKGIHLEERGTISEKRIQNCKQNSVWKWIFT